ncbi:MAG TPA: methyltransferase domain-containing protein [Candidatus Saccharimonadales bacterium]|nr:methyltransferase domain-containing protein [Candidatus Saccharimonadales bacterium]
MFEVAEAYEEMMGRWSRQLAPLFVEFAGVRDGDIVLDVGCGTGALSATLARVTGASKIVGIDPSNGFIEYARTQVADPRVTFELGDAQDLPYSDGSFDRCMALLSVNFVPDAPKAATEMRRVTKSGGVVATTMWEGSRAHELTGRFWDAAVAIDTTAKRPAERRGSYGSAAALSDLLKGAGLTDIEVTDLTMPCQFSSFDDYWLPVTEGQGPSGAYLTRLSEDHQAALREQLRQNLFGTRADGPFSLTAKAWAAKGIVP